MLTISEKVVVRVHDLVTWLSPTLEWSWGREVSYPPTPTSSPESSPLRYEIPQPQVLTDPGIDFSDVDKQQKEYESNHNARRTDCGSQTKVVVLSYPRYCRYRALLRRLEGAEPSWLCSSIAAALGGFTATPGTRVLFCRDTFDYPDLETHELLCNHLGKSSCDTEWTVPSYTWGSQTGYRIDRTFNENRIRVDENWEIFLRSHKGEAVLVSLETSSSRHIGFTVNILECR